MENIYIAQEQCKKAIDIIWIQLDIKRWDEAIALLKEAIELGDVEAYYYLGRCYVWGDAGLGVPKNEEEGYRLYKKGVALGSSLCVLGLQRSHLLTPEIIKQCVKSPSEAFAEVMAMAQNNNPFSCYIIGNAYYYCDINAFAKDKTEAFVKDTMKWEEKKKLWRQEAKKWFVRASELGVSYAMSNLAHIYEEDGDMKTSIHYLKMATKINSGQACSNMGRLYSSGIGVKKDLKQALEWFQKGADLRDNYCLWRIGRAWESGEYGKVDDEKAHTYFMKALALGSEYALASLGHQYKNGRGVEYDILKAVEYYLMGLEVDDDNEIPFCLGEIYSKCDDGVEQDLEKAWHYYKMSEEKGNEEASERLKSFNEEHPELSNKLDFTYCENAYIREEKGSAIKLAQFYLKDDCKIAFDLLEGAIYTDEEDIQQVYEILILASSGKYGDDGRQYALDILELANENELEGAEYAFGRALCLLIEGEAPNPDEPAYKKAIQFFEKAIRKGQLEAYIALGEMYENGYGTEINIHEAIKIYSKGMEAGNGDCAYNIGIIYYNGNSSLKRDYKKAREYMERAVENGCVSAYAMLGRMYMRAKGVFVNVKKAKEYYMKGYELEDSDCAMELGLGKWLYFKRFIWNKKADKQRFDYFLSAYKWGKREAIVKLGKCYLFGTGVEIDEAMAFQLFEQSMNMGCKSGAIELADCYKYGWGVKENRARANELKEIAKTLPYD